MRYGSVCSGVEAATVAWHPLGWEPQWFSEIEPFPSAVLAHHYPEVPNLGDMTKFKEWTDDPIDLLVGGTPCQSFSIAGLRKGLDDPRGNLMLTFVAIAARYRPRWVVWENVPGVLSSNGGRDFGTFLTALGEVGYGFAYRVLDAQYFGVAQRRRRVFVVGYLGDWRRAAAVLFERESLSGHPAPSRAPRQEAAGVAGPLTAGMHKGPRGTEAVESNHIGAWPASVASTLNAAFGSKLGLEDQHINSGAPLFVPTIAFPAEMSGTQAASAVDVSPSLSVGHTTAVAWSIGPSGGERVNVAPTLDARCKDGPIRNQIGTAVAWSIMPQNSGKDYKARQVEVAQPLMAAGPSGGNQGGDYIQQASVRRLTPRECERLQGFPDDYTLIQCRNKPAADGPRYKAMGNSMAVPVMRWIGKRIQMVEDMK